MLIHIALREFVATSCASEESTATAVDIVYCLVHSLSISSKLRVRAIVWKRGAHQPGGPSLRATTALHPRSSPPGMDIGGKGVWKTRASPQLTYVLPTAVGRRQAQPVRRSTVVDWEATGSPGSSKHINRLGRRQAHPVGGKQKPEQGMTADTRGSSERRLEGVFHVFTIYFVLPQPT